MWNIILLLFFLVFFVTDIVTNIQDGIPTGHIWHEVILCLMAAGALITQIIVITGKNKHINLISSELLKVHDSYKTWKAKSHDQARVMRNMIDQQFIEWQLSQSERDVALLLIKGFSMKEIAEFRSTHEKTVRQQATNVYKKSGLSGRQELSAFFLEDILNVPSAI